MNKYECIACGYIYDPELGDPSQDIPAGTAFEDLPDDWVCPDCGASKDQFEKIYFNFQKSLGNPRLFCFFFESCLIIEPLYSFKIGGRFYGKCYL